MSRFRKTNHITIPGFAVTELDLSGNELICYSLIYGFTQDEESEFNGSLNYVASALNVTKQNAKRILDRLIEKNLIVKREEIRSKSKMCFYSLSEGWYQNDTGGGIKTATGAVSKQQRGGIKMIPNNININIIDNNIKKGTSENLCLFENSKYSDLNKFKAEFDKPDFADIDIEYYYHAVADWSAQGGKKKRDWIATARNFMRGDKDKGKLKKIQTQQMTAGALEYLKSMAGGL